MPLLEQKQQMTPPSVCLKTSQYSWTKPQGHNEGANALPHKENAEVRRKDLTGAKCQQTLKRATTVDIVFEIRGHYPTNKVRKD